MIELLTYGRKTEKENRKYFQEQNIWFPEEEMQRRKTFWSVGESTMEKEKRENLLETENVTSSNQYRILSKPPNSATRDPSG